MQGSAVSERESPWGRMLSWGKAIRCGALHKPASLSTQLYDVSITDTGVSSRKSSYPMKALPKLIFLLQVWLSRSSHLRKLSPKVRIPSVLKPSEIFLFFQMPKFYFITNFCVVLCLSRQEGGCIPSVTTWMLCKRTVK